ncbi:MAG TPA: PEPxxWA-CTERM sorting domain-containing protein [Usitatibacter sp.]|nr:PEPxxWA-CTERM sorting domain-containing protein [Usitatibacter sp.]
MKPIYRALAVAVSLGLASAAGVAMAGDDTSSKNPISRGGKDPFHSGPLYATPRSGGDLGGIGRPAPRSHAAQVTPVPEPSQWAMMIAGLALVGFIVRRNRQK